MDANATTVRKAGPEDLIATAWFSLGFKPTESLILAGVEGARHRIGLILRTDLPAPTAKYSLVTEVVKGSIEPLAESPADAVAAIIVSEQALALPTPPIVSVLRRQIRMLGLRVFDILGVTPTAYRSLRCHDPACCPAEGKPIEAVMSSRSAATHVLNGETLADSEEEFLRDVQPEPGLSPQPGPRPLSVKQRWRRWNDWIEALAAAQTGEAGGVVPTLPGFSGALNDPFLRDAVLMNLLDAPQLQVKAMLNAGYSLDADSLDTAPHADVPPAPDLGELLAHPPDEDRLGPGQALLAGAVRVAAPGDRAPGLAVLALLAWYQGKGARSRLLAERAHADDPRLSLTRLVDTLLLRRVPPPWVGIGPEE